MSALIVRSETIDDRGQLAAVIEAIFEESEFDTDDLDVCPGERHDDWQVGQPCPECGSDLLSVMATAEELYVSEDGAVEYLQPGDALGPDLNWMCAECLTDLDQQPYELLR